MTIDLTRDQFVRGCFTFSEIAKENISIEFFSNGYYVFGSELAVLRLADKYKIHANDKASKGFSPNAKSFFFRLDTPEFRGEFDLVLPFQGSSD